MCTKMEQPLLPRRIIRNSGIRPVPGQPLSTRLQTPETQPGAQPGRPLPKSQSTWCAGSWPRGQRRRQLLSSQGSDTGASLKLASSGWAPDRPQQQRRDHDDAHAPGQYFYPRGGSSGGGAGAQATSLRAGRLRRRLCKSAGRPAQDEPRDAPNVSLGTSGAPAGPGGVYAGPGLLQSTPTSAAILRPLRPPEEAGAAVGTGARTRQPPSATSTPPFAGGHPAQLGLGPWRLRLQEEPQTVPERAAATPRRRCPHQHGRPGAHQSRAQAAAEPAGGHQVPEAEAGSASRLEDKVKTLQGRERGAVNTAGLLRGRWPSSNRRS